MGLNYEVIKPAIGAMVHLERNDIGDPAASQELLELLERALSDEMHRIVMRGRAGGCDAPPAQTS